MLELHWYLTQWISWEFLESSVATCSEDQTRHHDEKYHQDDGRENQSDRDRNHQNQHSGQKKSNPRAKNLDALPTTWAKR